MTITETSIREATRAPSAAKRPASSFLTPKFPPPSPRSVEAPSVGARVEITDRDGMHRGTVVSVSDQMIRLKVACGFWDIDPEQMIAVVTIEQVANATKAPSYREGQFMRISSRWP